MGKKKAKKSFVSPAQLLVESFEYLRMDEGKKSMLDILSSMIEDEVRKQSEDFISSVDEEISRVRSHFDDLRVMIPEKIRDLTVGEIISAGGSIELQDNNDNLVVNVPKDLYADSSIADTLASSRMITDSAMKSCRPVLNDATNSVRRTGLRSTVKRSRIPTGMTPSSTKRGKNTSIGSVSSFLAPSTARVTRSTARKAVPFKPHLKPSTVSQPGPMNGPANVNFPTPNTNRNAGEGGGGGAMYQFAVVNNVTINNIASQNGGSGSLVNPKTPGGNNLFRKLPRVPDPEEDMNIVVYSNQGTPLVVDPVEVIKRKQYGKSITNK